MKNENLEEAFNDGFLRYSNLIQLGDASFGAVSELATLEHCLPQLSRELQAKWRERISKEVLSEDVIRELKVETEKAIEKIRRILSIGTRWDPDELLLVWTYRIQIEMVVRFLSERRQLTEHDFFLEDVDEDMLRVAKSKTNKQGVQRAIGLIKRNWGLPISSRWLDSAITTN